MKTHTKRRRIFLNNLQNWDQEYDVIVLGFGGAGATAARFAADAGASVLLVDSAPEGHEGGNTRYSGQLVGSGDDFDQLKTYYKGLTSPMFLEENMIDTYVEGMVEMKDYFRKYLDVEPFSVTDNWDKTKQNPSWGINEYPEISGATAYDMQLVHDGWVDSALWKNLRKHVLQRKDKITVWYSSTACHLIKDNDGTIVGVEIEHQHISLNIRARNGVVMSTGGFENNPQMIQDYLGAPRLSPLGSLYNKGIGIKLGEEAGAEMWHMQNYESIGLLHGLTIDSPAGERGPLILAWPNVSEGSVFVAGDDGSRYFDETEHNRHGHLYNHGQWRVPHAQVHPHLIFDQTQWEIFHKNDLPVKNFDEITMKAGNIADLAKIINADPEILNRTVDNISKFIDLGEDYAYGRPIDTLRAFDEGPYYAVPMRQVVLNTQGGPKRNTKGEVLAPNGKVIPHLYSAGELGGICANHYQGGNNLAECLIWGKIAGQNAARLKNGSHSKYGNKSPSIVTETNESSFKDADSKTLFANNTELENFSVGKDQYLGVSNSGMGNEIVVRVTYSDSKLKNIEVLKQTESADVGLSAVEQLPKKMIEANSVHVDSISGASVTSKALEEAVTNAISKVNS